MATQLSRRYQITSKFNIDYSDRSILNTLDLHFPGDAASSSPLWLIYIHGGAFRDPLQTSTSILATLPTLFDPTSSYYTPGIFAVASINYRLSPYPSHPTLPSREDDPSRTATWPDHLEDIRAGISWTLQHGRNHDPRRRPDVEEDQTPQGYILAGHSVGGTMTLKICQALAPPFAYPIAALSLCGIYDFTALREAHEPNRKLYEEFTNGAFGPEAEGGWVRGLTTKDAIRKEVKLLVLAHSKTDSLVDWQQTCIMSDVLDRMDSSQQGMVMELHGDHKEIYEKGTEIARTVHQSMRILEASS